MPDVPENVPIYIASDFESDTDEEEDKVAQAPAKPADKLSRQSLMEDRSASNWQPYTKDIVESKKEASKASVDKPLPLPQTTPVQVPVVAGIKRRTVTFLMAVTALNMLALGVYIGNRMLPRSPYTAAFDSNGKLFNPSSKAALTSVISEIVSRANPCVVNLDVRMAPKTVPNAGQINNYVNPSSEMMPYQASGLIVRSDGYIITSAHALKKYDSIEVTFYDNHKCEGTLVGKDNFTDLAIIKVDADNLPVLKFGDVQKLNPGDTVIAVGCPVGLDHTVTTGVVSSAHRSLAEVNNNRVELIQHDALLYIGSSGGPLLDIHGDVVGINAAVRGGTPGMSFSVPSDVAAHVSQELIEHGSIARPFMGVVMEDVDPNMTRSLTLPSNSVAVKVIKVEPEGPGDHAGMLNGDIIVKVKGIQVKSSREVRTLTRDDKPDQVIDLVILRNGKEQTIKLKLGNYDTFRPHG